MNRDAVRGHLIRLRDLIREERDYAKKMDLEAMAQVREEKYALIHMLEEIKELHPDDYKYAREIRQENRRNAFLFKSTLNWIQDTMEFFGRKSVPATYGKYGTPTNNCVNGRLLSGRI